MRKVLPRVGEEGPDENMYLRCFDDIYGYRAKNEGKGRHLYYLNPWEFLMLWECLPLPPPPSPLSMKVGESYEPNPAAETDDIIFSLVASRERSISVRGTIRVEDIDP